jgi:hypothetical protein
VQHDVADIENEKSFGPSIALQHHNGVGENRCKMGSIKIINSTLHHDCRECI